VTNVFLPDNTVLINFAIIRRMDLLAELLRGQGSWCISIARECRQSQAYYPDLAQAGAIGAARGDRRLEPSGESGQVNSV